LAVFRPHAGLRHAGARALNEVWLTLLSSIQSRANLPDWMSLSTRFISFLVSGDAGCAAGIRIERIDHENTIAQLITSQLLVVLGMVR
jgi:hypothetical protein